MIFWQYRQSLISVFWLRIYNLCWWRRLPAALYSGFVGKTHLSDIGKIAVPLSIINAVADHKFILNAEPDPIGWSYYFIPSIE